MNISFPNFAEPIVFTLCDILYQEQKARVIWYTHREKKSFLDALVTDVVEWYHSVALVSKASLSAPRGVYTVLLWLFVLGTVYSTEYTQ